MLICGAVFFILQRRSSQENVSRFPAIHIKPQRTIWNLVSLVLLIHELQQSKKSPHRVPAAQKKTRTGEQHFFAYGSWPCLTTHKIQFIIFQTLFHTNNFAVSLMHLSVYLFSSTICLSCSLAPHMFTATTPPRWQMSSRANFIGINKKARGRWKAMERANVIWGGGSVGRKNHHNNSKCKEEVSILSIPLITMNISFLPCGLSMSRSMIYWQMA